MHFLPDVYVPCEQCHGKRYNRETLEVRFKGKTIADVLEMPIEEALEFFAHIPKISRRVQALFDVGLGYMRLGQPATTLSGGEAQRVKLAAELSKVATGTTMYILDEPTTGLHFADIQRLLEVLDRLVQTGNSVVVIEHNLDVIKVSDRLIDLGPEGGDEGGQVIAQGTPEQVAQVAGSHTAHFLAEMLPVKVTRSTKAAPRASKTKPATTSGRASASKVARNGGGENGSPTGHNGANGNGSATTPSKSASVRSGTQKPAAGKGSAKPAARSKARAR
jgi:excinuclease ABC subunit A